MDRETFRILSYGKYAFTRRQDTIEVKEMELFVEGSLFAYDFAKHEIVESKVKVSTEGAEKGKGGEG